MSRRILMASCLSLMAITSQLDAQGRTVLEPRRSPASKKSRRVQAVPNGDGIVVRGGSAELAAGKVPLRDVLRFIQLESGSPVLFPSVTDDPQFRRDITFDVVTKMDPFTLELAVAILRSNGYRLIEEKIESGQRTVLHVRHRNSRSRLLPASPTRVVAGRSLDSLGDGGVVTAVIHLKALSAQAAVEVIRVLLDLPGTRSEGGSNVIGVPSRNAVVVRASTEMVAYIRQIIAALDQPAQSPSTPEPESGGVDPEAGQSGGGGDRTRIRKRASF